LFAIIDLMATTPTFFRISDGSALHHRGTFGWFLSLPCGTRPATCAGNAYGYRVSSFQTKGYGMLSLTHFLLRLFEFCHCPIPAGIHLATNNEGLVTHTVIEHPNATLKPDWNIVRTIDHTLMSFPAPQIHHVKGHQDKDTEYCDLPLQAQLNIDADKLAGDFHSTYSATPAIAIRLGSNPVQLTINSATITSRVKQVAHHAATAPTLREYIHSANRWSLPTFDLVDWPSNGHAIRKSYTNKTFIVKLLHNLLPTGKHVHQYKTTYCHPCPSWDEPFEDRSHLYRCRDPTRAP
jgi:hypothetical protein